jgi:hypothetical protein
MKWRELVRKVMAEVLDLESDVTILILTRDKDNCVIRKDYVGLARFINGKIMIESDSIVENVY